MLLSETSNAFKKTTQHKVLHRATENTAALNTPWITPT